MNILKNKDSGIRNSTQENSGNERGMTLVELLAVIVLIGLIATVILRGVGGASDSAKARVNMLRMEKLRTALSNYRLEYSTYPESLQGLIQPSASARSSGKPFFKFADAEELKDAYNQEFVYKVENNGRGYELTSFGRDGKSGGDEADQDVTVRP